MWASHRGCFVKNGKTLRTLHAVSYRERFGEDAKTQPEDIFSLLHNFILSLEKAHKYNVERDAEKAKKKRLEEQVTV